MEPSLMVPITEQVEDMRTKLRTDMDEPTWQKSSTLRSAGSYEIVSSI